MKKRITSMLLALAMVMGLIGPTAMAASQRAYDYEYTDTLSTLAGQAARSGNLDLAAEYESELQSLGVDILTTSEVIQLQNEFEGIMPLADNVPEPPNTNSVHWYKTTKYGHTYNGRKYDIIQIKAVAWDTPNQWLHAGGVESYAPTRSTDIPVIAGSKLVTALIERTVGSATVTIADFFTSIGQAAFIDSYSYLTIPNSSQDGHITASRDEYLDIYFYWVSEKGASDYSLRTKEAVGNLNYSYTVKGKLVKPDGSSRLVNSGGSVPKTTFLPTTRATWDSPCRAYLSNTYTEYWPGDIEFNINGTDFWIPQIPVPQNMEALLY